MVSSQIREVVRMSVPKPQRSVSDMEFLRTARELQIFTIHKCKNFPKRYSFYISIPLANASTRVYENVKRGNSIYPSIENGRFNAHEVQMRRDFFLQANAELYSMVSQIEVAEEMFGLDKEIIHQWIKLVDREITLVKGVMDSDKKRYTKPN